ncbi:MAG: MATE family efflux transporter [Deltaproteobacteria bacterium]|nr:MATE family efflux transporter [Deltaproteobacteria bacterium]
MAKAGEFLKAFEAVFSRTELKRLAWLGIPVFVTHLAQMGMNFADIVMTGWAGPGEMAAVGVACSIWNPLSLFCWGCLLPQTPLIAQLVGARRQEEAPHLFRQGLWLVAGLFVAIGGILYGISWHLDAFGLDAALAQRSGAYLRCVVWGLPALMLFVCCRCLAEGFGWTRPAMIFGVLGLLLNIPCNYILIYGKLGLPALGAVGCGISSALCFWGMALAMLFHLRREIAAVTHAPLFSRRSGEKFCDPALILRIVRLGFPNAFAMLFEVSMFALTALFLAPFGAVTVAGHQAALNYSGMLYIIPLALGMTVTIRVGHCLGAGNQEQARIAARTALAAGVFFSLATAVLTCLLREQIVHIYGDSGEVAALAAQLLMYVAAYQVVDAVQTIAQGILRGYNDTLLISRVSLFAYPFIGIVLGCTLAYGWLGTPLRARGFWIAYIVAMGFAMCCYLPRVRHLHRLDARALRGKLSR